MIVAYTYVCHTCIHNFAKKKKNIMKKQMLLTPWSSHLHYAAKPIIPIQTTEPLVMISPGFLTFHLLQLFLEYSWVFFSNGFLQILHCPLIMNYHQSSWEPVLYWLDNHLPYHPEGSCSVRLYREVLLTNRTYESRKSADWRWKLNS